MISQVRGVLAKCFEIAVEKNMLTEQQVRTARTRVTDRNCRSYGGVHGRERLVYVSLNLGGSVKGPGQIQAHWCLGSSPTHAKFRFAKLRTEEGYYIFNEYSSFWEDPDIGSYWSKNPVACAAALVAHEVSHAANYCTDNPRFKGRNHDGGWKRVYSILRSELLAKLGDIKEEVVPTTIEELPVRVAASTRNRSNVNSPVQRVWNYMDQHPYATRKEAVRDLTAMGINQNTASTQYFAWRRSR